MCIKLVLIICILNLSCISQIPIKDTIIDSVKYSYAHYRFNGRIKILSQAKAKKDGGKWLYYDRKGIEKWCGSYDSLGRKADAWWYKRREIIYYNEGKKTGKRGFGCKGCGF